MLNVIINFKKENLLSKLFIVYYFFAIFNFVINCVTSTYLPNNNEWYGYWNKNGSVSGLGIFLLVWNSLFLLNFIIISIFLAVKKPWIANLEIEKEYREKRKRLFLFNFPLVIVSWVMIIIGLINRPGLIMFSDNDLKAYSFLFLNMKAYFEPVAVVVFVIMAMLWVGILTQISKDISQYLKNKKYQRHVY